jgi:hypothetical protein
MMLVLVVISWCLSPEKDWEFLLEGVLLSLVPSLMLLVPFSVLAWIVICLRRARRKRDLVQEKTETV